MPSAANDRVDFVLNHEPPPAGVGRSPNITPPSHESRSTSGKCNTRTLNAIMLANCSEQLQSYLLGSAPYNTCVHCRAETVDTCLANAPQWMQADISVGVGCLAEAVESCILSNAPEWMKSNTAAAGVLLGLLPTILSLAGSDQALLKLAY